MKLPIVTFGLAVFVLLALRSADYMYIGAVTVPTLAEGGTSNTVSSVSDPCRSLPTKAQPQCLELAEAIRAQEAKRAEARIRTDEAGRKEEAERTEQQRRRKEYIQLAITGAFLIPAFYIVLAKRYPLKDKNWAYATLGTIVGFWLKG